MDRATQAASCDNMNHRRSQAPVRNCPNCGGIVNGTRQIPVCSNAKHAAARRTANTFCVDCGLLLIESR